MTRERRREALDRFEAATDLPMLVLAVLMIPLLIAPLFGDLPEAADTIIVGLDFFIWAAFAIQFGVRLWLTPDPKLRFALRNWADLLIVLIPLLRPLRVIQSARALRLLRLTRLVGFLGAISAQTKRLLTRHHLHIVLLVAAGVVVGAGALVYYLEEGAGGSITSVPTALWWAITTVTTVGYGDTYPVTPAGRGVAAGLMLVGIGLVGVLTANIAAFLVEHPNRDDGQPSDRQLLEQVLARLDQIEASMLTSHNDGQRMTSRVLDSDP